MHAITDRERILTLDIIRGIALLGILLANMPEYAGLPSRFSGADAYVRLFLDLFVQTKWYTVFSFLFGVGFYIFMSRAEARGERASLLFGRRLAALFGFGLVHLFFFWGDILHLYAAIGVLLLLFFRKSERTLLVTALVLIGFSMFPAVLLAFLPIDMSSLSGGSPPREGGFWERGLATIRYVFGMELTSSPQLLPEILGLFLLGVYCGKKRFFERVDLYRKGIRRLQIGSLLLTLPLWFLILSAFAKSDTYGMYTAYTWMLVSGKSLAVFYVTSLMLLGENPVWQKRLQPIARLGKLALTAYLTQTLLAQSLVLLLDAAFDIRLQLTTATVLSLMIFLFQLWLGRLWLAHYRLGPMEWVWRTFTYGRRQPLLKPGA